MPGLLSSYIERDSWIKLNVKPSKIVQQDTVLTELFAHAKTIQSDSSSMQVYKYLLAVNKLFERGLLSKFPVCDANYSQTMATMQDSFQYFIDWYKECHTKDCVNKDKKQFLAWQTWDLLTILMSGAKALVKDFLSRNHGYFIVLSRINGSCVESLFSQLKYSVGGKLTSLNYGNARASVLVKSNCVVNNPSNMDYRNEDLFLD